MIVVVLYHSGWEMFENGFLGVDVFFVISGYLITSMILRDLHAGSFSFSRFYLRRAKRLLPAVYCTLLVTTVASYWFLTDSQWQDYYAQLVGALTFTANIVLPFQTGYFEGDPESKPLLHIWSLSLEEQYYLIIPLVLSVLSATRRLHALAVGFLASYAACIWLSTVPFDVRAIHWRLPDVSTEELAFFLFPTRAWELLAGSLVAWLSLYRANFHIGRVWKIIAVVAVLFLVMFELDPTHPRGDATLVVLATAILLVGRNNWLPDVLPARAVERIGDWSYSIYLVHWPLFAFAHNAYLGSTPPSVAASLLLVTLLLGYLQYEYVEQPFRRGWKQAPVAAWGWLAVATVSVVGSALPHMLDDPGKRDFAQVRRANYGLSSICNGQIGAAGLPEDCYSKPDPAFAVWGDSFAMHLVPGLLANTEVRESGLVQATKGVCGPVAGLAGIDERYDENYARSCLAFNQQALELLTTSESVRHVVLSSTFRRFLTGELPMLTSTGPVPPDVDLAIERIVQTIGKLRDAGKRVVIVAPPPSGDFDIGECLERREAGLVNFLRSNCDILDAEYRERWGVVHGALRIVEQRADVNVLWIERLTCQSSHCDTEMNGVPLYRDAGHLSVDGSVMLLQAMDWTALTR